MDLAGPKIRTGEVCHPKGEKRIASSDLLAIVPPGGLCEIPIKDEYFAVECTLPEALGGCKIGDRVCLDDGKQGAEVERVETWGVLTRVTSTGVKGIRLKSERGSNSPRYGIDGAGDHQERSRRSRLLRRTR